MRPCKFAYKRPATLSEAIDLLSENSPDAVILSGGQSLIPALNLRLARPSLLVDIAHLPEMAGIVENEDGVEIGALATHAEIQGSTVLAKSHPMLAKMADNIGHAAIRNRGTMGGSLANADPASEWPCAVMALNGAINTLGPSGKRQIPAKDFFHSYYTTALKPEEILTSVVLPPLHQTTRWSYQQVSRQAGAFALVLLLAYASFGSDGEIEKVHLAIGGCDSRPVMPVEDWSFLLGAQPAEALVEQALQCVNQGINPHSDINASADDRRQMATTLARRALLDVMKLNHRGAQ